MGGRVVAIVSGFLLMLVMFVAFSTATTVAAVTGWATAQSGRVEVQRRPGGKWEPLAGRGKEPARIAVGDRLRTGADGSLALLWADGTRMQLDPDTELEVRKFQFGQKVKAQASLFRLDLGRVWARVTHELQGDSRFELETPQAVAGVRGTIFSVAVDSRGTQVRVYDGKVQVTRLTGGSGTEVVAPGEKASATEHMFASAKMQPDEMAAFSSHEILLPSLKFSSVRRSARNGVLQVRGTAEPGAGVTVGGQAASVMPDGGFTASVPVEPATKSVAVVVTDAAGHRRTADYPLP